MLELSELKHDRARRQKRKGRCPVRSNHAPIQLGHCMAQRVGHVGGFSLEHRDEEASIAVSRDEMRAFVVRGHY